MKYKIMIGLIITVLLLTSGCGYTKTIEHCVDGECTEIVPINLGTMEVIDNKVKDLNITREGKPMEIENRVISFPVWSEDCNENSCHVFNYDEIYTDELGDVLFRGVHYNITCNNSTLEYSQGGDRGVGYTSFWCEKDDRKKL